MVPVVTSNGMNLGFLRVKQSVTYTQIRKLVAEELDEVPESYVFVIDDLPLGRRQEDKELLGTHTTITLRSSTLQPPTNTSGPWWVELAP